MHPQNTVSCLSTGSYVVTTQIVNFHAGLTAQTQLLKPQSPIYQRLADIAEIGDDGGVEAVRKAFDLYQSCMDADTIENLGVTPLLSVIRDFAGTLHASYVCLSFGVILYGV